MPEHHYFEDLLPLYVADQLSQAEQDLIEQHLLECDVCRADLELWQTVGSTVYMESSAIVLPPHLPDQVLTHAKVRLPLPYALARSGQLLRAQTMLIHRELWPICAVMMAIGVLVSLLAESATVIHFLAPLIGAAGFAALYGPYHDPVTELSLATPTSPWKILLARLTLVSSYNLLLALMASCILLVFIPSILPGVLIVGWLGPMAFLSALALFLSIWIGTNNTVLVVSGLWFVRYLFLAPFFNNQLPSLLWFDFLFVYQQFWQSLPLLLFLSVMLLGATICSVNRSEQLLMQNHT